MLGAVTDLSRTLVIQIGHDFVINGEKSEAERLFDRAIQGFDQVITLSPSALAYSGRGAAYFLKGDFTHAIADFDQATKLDPRYPNAYHNRGIAHRARGEFGQAVADFDQAIAIDPKYALAYYDRGVTFFDQGSLAKALADFKESRLLSPKRLDTALWLYLIERRSNVPTDLAEDAKVFDGQGWPAPVIGLFLGKTSPAEILEIAKTTGPLNKEGQICEAEFYVGEFDLLNEAQEDAGQLLRLAAENCPQIYEVRRAAEKEIKVLDRAPNGKPGR